MKLSREFIMHNMGGESILVATGGAAFKGMVRGNATLGAILELLREETSEEAVIAAMLEKYDGPEDTIARDVRTVVDGLRKIGALDE